MKSNDFEKLKKGIYNILGFNSSKYEIKHFKRRICSRMLSLGLSSYSEYLDVLQTDENEREKLKEALTINVTEFFRDPEVYKAFSDKILPAIYRELAERNRTNLKIWSIGCATGEEPYSIALCVSDFLKKIKRKINVKIFATDIDVKALKIARKGEYKDVSKIPQKLVSEHLIKLKDNRYRFKEYIKRMIIFKEHDIFSGAYFKNMNTIFCRNTIIYFNDEAKKEAYRIFNNSLILGGYLILGRVEAFITHDKYGFKVVDRKNHIFKKIKEIRNREYG